MNNFSGKILSIYIFCIDCDKIVKLEKIKYFLILNAKIENKCVSIKLLDLQTKKITYSNLYYEQLTKIIKKTYRKKIKTVKYMQYQEDTYVVHKIRISA